MRKHFSQKNNRGAVLLIAVLMTSVVLSVGMGIYERTYKSLVFSSYWEQTQIAFAAADAGFECALYLDTHPTVVPKCFNQDIPAAWVLGGVTPSEGIDLATPSGGCVNIQITKPLVPVTPPTDPATFYTATHIEARGYNDGCSSTNPRRVERGLKIDY
jgi:hypothetical protein